MQGFATIKASSTHTGLFGSLIMATILKAFVSWVRYLFIVTLLAFGVGAFCGSIAVSCSLWLMDFNVAHTVRWVGIPIFCALAMACIFVLPKHLRTAHILAAPSV